MVKYELEIHKGAKNIIESLAIKPGEMVAITADTESDEDVVKAAAAMAHAAGAKPMILYVPAPQGVGKAADPYLPLEPLAQAVGNSDVWIEFNNEWLLYSTVFERAFEKNPNIRYICLVGMDKDMLVRTVARLDFPKLKAFMEKITEKTKAAKRVVVQNAAGTCVEFDNDENNPFDNDDGDASGPGMHFLAGQISWCPKFDTIRGNITFDGSLTPPVGLLTSPVELTVEEGRIVEIKGGKEAAALKNWLLSFNHPNMFRLAHICYGFNPGARLTGNVLEDERVWGCTEWGIGYMNKFDAPPAGIDAPSHCDGICLNSTVILDGKAVLKDGKVVDEELKQVLNSDGDPFTPSEF